MPKNKKNKKMLIIVFTILVLIILGIVLYKNFNENSEIKTSVNDFESVKEIIEYNDCKYIKTANSNEDGYSKDIYLEFSKPPIEQSGETNEVLYNNLTSQIAGKIKPTNFRLIDEKRNIIIRIQFNDKGEVTLYSINNDTQYFEHLITNYQVSNYVEDKQTPINVQSEVLISIINNNWSVSNLGTKDSSCDNYDIYFDEGYKIRNIYQKVFHLIFTKKYNQYVFDNITTGMNNEEIQKILGEPTYKNEECSIIGYKNEEFYTFFHNGEISIYKNEKDYDTSKFAEITTNFINTNDYNKFISDLTNLWPDYDEYVKNKNSIMLKYTLKGLIISFNSIQRNGITIYNNYSGQITNSISMNDIKNKKSIPAYVYTQLDTNLVFEKEINRISSEFTKKNMPNNEELDTDNYTVSYSIINGQGYNEIRFYAKDYEHIDMELKEKFVNQIFKIDNENFIYSISGKGIYKFNLSNREYDTIIQGNETFKISKIENNIIYYDNTQIDI